MKNSIKKSAVFFGLFVLSFGWAISSNVQAATPVEMYDNVFASMISKIEKLEDQIQLAAESRNRLLPKIMNGEISV